MKLHANARSARIAASVGRRVVDEGWSLTAAARRRPESASARRRSGSAATARRARRVCWIVARRRRGAAPDLRASGSQSIAALRRLRMTGAEIAELLGMPLSTVSAVLARIGLGKLGRLEPPEPPNRYERARPGELIHIDVKKLGRIRRRRAPRHRPPPQPDATAARVGEAHRRLGVRPRLRRRRHPPGLRRGPRRREGHHSGRLPAPRGRVLRPPRHPRRAA